MIRTLSISLAALLLATFVVAALADWAEIQAPRAQDEIQAPLSRDEIQAPVAGDELRAPAWTQAMFF